MIYTLASAFIVSRCVHVGNSILWHHFSRHSWYCERSGTILKAKRHHLFTYFKCNSIIILLILALVSQFMI